MHRKTVEQALLLGLAVAVILSIVNISLIVTKSSKVQQAMEEQSIPATIELLTISGSSCADCFDLAPVLEGIKKGNLNISREETIEFTLPEAQELIIQYGLKKLPTIIVRGQVEKLRWNQQWKLEPEEKPEYALFVGVTPPYLTPEGTVKGLVALTHIIDQTCSQCSDLSPLINVLKQNKVKFSVEEKIDYTSPQAQELIRQLDIERVPAVVVSKDVLEYPAVAEIWPQLNTTEKQGFYAVHSLSPPYLDLQTKKVEGLVTLKYLQDYSCATCYDVALHKQILTRNGITVVDESTIDISTNEGKSLRQRYGITKVPTVLISSDVGIYAGFNEAWESVGEITDDGWYLMQQVELLGTYKDLTTGEIVEGLVEGQQH